MNGRTVVVGVGNRDREDDAAGPLVVDQIRRRRPDLATVISEGDLTLLPLEWEEGADLVIIDALALHGGQGSPALVEVDAHDLPDTHPVSSHGLGLIGALRLAIEIGRRPGRVRVLGVTGRRFGVGPPSAALVDAVPRLAVEALSFVEGRPGSTPIGNLGAR